MKKHIFLVTAFVVILLTAVSCTPREKAVVYYPAPAFNDNEVVVKRILALNPKNSVEFTADGRIQIGLYEPEDSLCLPQLLTVRGETYVAETYNSSEVYQAISNINSSILQVLDVPESAIDEKKAETPWFDIFSPSGGGDWPGVGYARKQHMEQIDAILRLPNVRVLFPDNITFMWTAIPHHEDVYELIAVKQEYRLELSDVTVEKTTVDINNFGTPEVLITLAPQFRDGWARLTAINVGRSLACVMDGRVLMYPRVQSEITSGKLMIAGSFDMQQIKEFAAIIAGGVLIPTE